MPSRRPSSFVSASELKTALAEVQEKSPEQIESDTAKKWAARALACYQLYRETSLGVWLLRAEDYGHEAIEHAALVRDEGATLREVEILLANRR